MKALSRHNIQLMISSENEDEKRQILKEIERVINKHGKCKVVTPGLYQFKLRYTDISLKQISVIIDTVRLDTNVSRPVNAVISSNDDITISKIISDEYYEYELEMKLIKDSYMIFNNNTIKEELYLPEKMIMNLYTDNKDTKYVNEIIIPKINKRLLSLKELFSKNNIQFSIKLIRKGEE